MNSTEQIQCRMFSIIIEASATKEDHSTLSDGGRGYCVWEVMGCVPEEKPFQLSLRD